MSKHTAIIDYGFGNLHSIGKALEKVGAKVTITADAKQIAAADRVVLPGVGAIRDAMAELQRLELTDSIHQALATRPVLGVCLGMQALLTHSEENGGIACLGHFAGEVKHFTAEAGMDGLSIPHMGWNRVHQTPHPQKPHVLWDKIDDNSRFYFVHSYFAAPENPETSTGETDYGIRFTSVLAAENCFATQFHPEKSHHDGLQLLENFTHWNP